MSSLLDRTPGLVTFVSSSWDYMDVDPLSYALHSDSLGQEWQERWDILKNCSFQYQHKALIQLRQLSLRWDNTGPGERNLSDLTTQTEATNTPLYEVAEAMENTYLDSRPAKYYRFLTNGISCVALDTFVLEKLSAAIHIIYNQLTNDGQTCRSDFKSLKIHIRQIIRLFNLIQRLWFGEVILRRKCHKTAGAQLLDELQPLPYPTNGFITVPDFDDGCHRRLEGGAILPGRYWTKRLKVNRAQYQRWRRFYVCEHHGSPNYEAYICAQVADEIAAFGSKRKKSWKSNDRQLRQTLEKAIRRVPRFLLPVETVESTNKQSQQQEETCAIKRETETNSSPMVSPTERAVQEGTSVATSVIHHSADVIINEVAAIPITSLPFCVEMQPLSHDGGQDYIYSQSSNYYNLQQIPSSSDSGCIYSESAICQAFLNRDPRVSLSSNLPELLSTTPEDPSSSSSAPDDDGGHQLQKLENMQTASLAVGFTIHPPPPAADTAFSVYTTNVDTSWADTLQQQPPLYLPISTRSAAKMVTVQAQNSALLSQIGLELLPQEPLGARQQKLPPPTTLPSVSCRGRKRRPIVVTSIDDDTEQPTHCKHLFAEQNRRMALKDGMDNLLEHLPAEERNGGRLKNAQILQKGADYIRSLKQKTDNQTQEIQLMQSEIQMLLDNASHPALHLSVLQNGSSDVRQEIKRYCNTVSKLRWKILLLSEMIETLTESYAENVTGDNVDELTTSCQQWASENCHLRSLKPAISEAFVRLSAELHMTNEKSLVEYVTSRSN